MRHITTFLTLFWFMRLNSYGSIDCIRFEGIISAHGEGTLLMFDDAKVQQKEESGKKKVKNYLLIMKFPLSLSPNLQLQFVR